MLIWFVFILLSLIIGYVKTRSNKIISTEQLEFIVDFFDRLIDFDKSFSASYDSWTGHGNCDTESYRWLLRNADRAQSLIGTVGLGRMYHQNGYVVNSYPVLIGAINEYKQMYPQRNIIDTAINSLNRGIGISERKKEEYDKKVRRPHLLLKEGIRTIFLLPLVCLQYIGIFNTKRLTSIKSSSVFDKIVAIITIVSGIVTIVKDYNELLKLMKLVFANLVSLIY